MRVVTAYLNPDLDGTACAIAYAELLRVDDPLVTAVLHGLPDKEARAALAHWHIDPPMDRGEIAAAEAVILVDTSNLSDLPEGFDASRVVEIVDHRELTEFHAFPNARAQVELVGAAATLIAEKFHAAGKIPAISTAGLLVGAISSNTLHLRTSNTTERDRAMFAWTQQLSGVDDGYFAMLRRARSAYAPGELAEYLWNDRSVRTTQSSHVIILQIEAEQAEKLLHDRRSEVEGVLTRVHDEERPDHVFVNVVDLETARNVLFSIYPETTALLSNRLGLRFSPDGIARPDRLLLRKQISPLL